MARRSIMFLGFRGEAEGSGVGGKSGEGDVVCGFSSSWSGEV